MSVEVAGEPPYHSMRTPGNPMDPFGKGFYYMSSETWTPNVNLYETASSYLVCVDLAGVDKEKIDVEVVEQRLKLRGTRAVPTHPELDDMPAHAEGEAGARRLWVHLMEIDHGGFCREVELPPDVRREQISATYRNGMLWVEIPKLGD